MKDERHVPPVVIAQFDATDELGAHVSAAGGVHRAPERAAQLCAHVVQLFTKAPSRWADPRIGANAIAAFRAERSRFRIRCAAVHDSYLINLATRDLALFRRSYRAFRNELARCSALGIEYLVTHPGNATDGNVDAALERNAEAIARALDEVASTVHVLLETTAGTGSALGSTFEELARIIELIPAALRDRMGVCLDTCHVWAAGYDLRSDFDGVFTRFDDVIGLERLRFFHLNDSRYGFGSRRDRHANIGRGALGREPFARLLNDERFSSIPKVIETPKGKNVLRADRANLRRLRSYRLL